MRRRLTLAAALLLLLLLGGITGCGSAGPKGDDPAAGPKGNDPADPDDTYRGIIAAQKQVASALGGIQDEASAEAALPKLEEMAARYAELDRRLKGLNLSPDQHGELIDKHEGQAGPAHRDLSRAATAARERAPQHAERIAAILGRMGMAQTTVREVSPKKE